MGKWGPVGARAGVRENQGDLVKRWGGRRSQEGAELMPATCLV